MIEGACKNDNLGSRSNISEPLVNQVCNDEERPHGVTVNNASTLSREVEAKHEYVEGLFEEGVFG